MSMDQNRFIELSTASTTATRTARGRRWRRSASTTTRRSTTRSAAWGIRRLFRCKTCEEELTISPGGEGGPADLR